MLVAPDDQPTPHEMVHEGFRMRVFPPYRGSLDLAALGPDSSAPLTELSDGLTPAEPQPIDANSVMDGLRVVAANVLQIDVLADEFDRRMDTDQDPPDGPVFDVANNCLLRLRHLTRAQQIRMLDPSRTIRRVTYLNDDETELEPTDGLLRGFASGGRSISFMGLPPSLWDAAFDVPIGYTPSPSWTLLLDAFGLLPEVGPPIVLAYSAIETRTDSALDLLARAAGLDERFWEWLTTREGKYYKEPSIAEKLDPLLRGVSGVSLKDDERLWEAFQNLRKARNTFAHQGVAKIGDVVVDEARTRELLVAASSIVDWVEALLPEDERRPPIVEWATVEHTLMLFAPEPEIGPDLANA